MTTPYERACAETDAEWVRSAMQHIRFGSANWCQQRLERAADTMMNLLNRVEELEDESEELDFLRHEGGPQSVAALEVAFRDCLSLLATIADAEKKKGDTALWSMASTMVERHEHLLSQQIPEHTDD